MIDKNLFRFLQFRDTIVDIRPLEEKHGITLPPIYRTFISVFKPNFADHKVKMNGDFRSFLVPFYSSLNLNEYSSEDDEMALENFKRPEEALTFLRSKEDYVKDYLFIANHGYAGGLLVGIADHNQDQIFHSVDTEEIEFIAGNIFEFLHRMQLVQFDFEAPSVNTSKLYKKWGEDFWRVKEGG